MHQRGTVFCAHPIGRPPQANAEFETWVRGELQRRNRNLSRMEGDADFRERIRRSIWPSKLGLSCDRILPARGILSFGGKVRLLLYVSAGWGGGLFSEKVPLSRCVFKRSICRGTFRPEQNQKTAKSLCEPSSARGYGWLRRLRNEAWKNRNQGTCVGIRRGVV